MNNLVIIVIFFLIVLIVIFNLTNKNKKVSKRPNEKVSSGEYITIKELDFHKSIKELDFQILSSACKSIFNIFRALEYVNKSPSCMDKIEWHSWQISILLFCLRNNYKFVIYDKECLIHKNILNLSEEKKRVERTKIYKKYSEKVNISENRDTLSKDLIWSAREVSLILIEILE
jgi:hypothetical protein